MLILVQYPRSAPFLITPHHPKNERSETETISSDPRSLPLMLKRSHMAHPRDWWADGLMCLTIRDLQPVISLVLTIYLQGSQRMHWQVPFPGKFWLVPQLIPLCFSGTHVWYGWRCRNGRTRRPRLLHERDEQKENLSHGDRNAATSWMFTWALGPKNTLPSTSTLK